MVSVVTTTKQQKLLIFHHDIINWACYYIFCINGESILENIGKYWIDWKIREKEKRKYENDND
jgi:hypothetical protein